VRARCSPSPRLRSSPTPATQLFAVLAARRLNRGEAHRGGPWQLWVPCCGSRLPHQLALDSGFTLNDVSAERLPPVFPVHRDSVWNCAVAAEVKGNGRRRPSRWRRVPSRRTDCLVITGRHAGAWVERGRGERASPPPPSAGGPAGPAAENTELLAADQTSGPSMLGCSGRA